MNIWIIITGIAIVFFGIIANVLAFMRYSDLKRLMKINKTTIGMVRFIKEIRNQTGNYSYYQLVYNIDGKEYSHKILTRSDKYNDKQAVSVIYLPNKPKISFCESEYGNFRLDSFRIVIFMIDLFFCFCCCDPDS